MDRITAQISELSDYERFQLLLRLSRLVPNSAVQSNLSAVRSRRRVREDLPVDGWKLNGFEYPEPQASVA